MLYRDLSTTLAAAFARVAQRTNLAIEQATRAIWYHLWVATSKFGPPKACSTDSRPARAVKAHKWHGPTHVSLWMRLASLFQSGAAHGTPPMTARHSA